MVVIGSSFISMEIVAACASRKLASIDVIGMEEFPFEAVLGKEVGAGLKKVSRSLFSASSIEQMYPHCSCCSSTKERELRSI